MADLAHEALGIGPEVDQVDPLEPRRAGETVRRRPACGAGERGVALAIVALDHQGAALVDHVEVADRGRALGQAVAQHAAGPFARPRIELQHAEEAALRLVGAGREERLLQHGPEARAVRASAAMPS